MANYDRYISQAEGSTFRSKDGKELPYKDPINRSFHVPALAGTSTDGHTVYIDKEVPKSIRMRGGLLDTGKYLAIHETTEFELMSQGMHYYQAHRQATAKEREAVEADGFDWGEYSAHMSSMITEAEKAPATHLPPDLNDQPYLQGGWSKSLVEKVHGARRTRPRT